MPLRRMAHLLEHIFACCDFGWMCGPNAVRPVRNALDGLNIILHKKTHLLVRSLEAVIDLPAPLAWNEANSLAVICLAGRYCDRVRSGFSVERSAARENHRSTEGV